jgi:EAL domain-containing protein (putative c-di-GMP-specific phosphodiesterase class I)
MRSLEFTLKSGGPHGGVAPAQRRAHPTSPAGCAHRDFGTGYSSLDYLRRFPVDRIKIAQIFVTDLGAPENTAIVKAALGLAHALGIEVIVEGVETVAQLALLKAWGCRYVQGYYHAKPLPVPEATELLRIGSVLHWASRPAVMTSA